MACRGEVHNLTDVDILCLEKEVTDDEIKTAFFDMGPLKAPGCDGLHALFFQSQWDTVGESVCRMVKTVFTEGFPPAELNKTLLVLIPKTVKLTVTLGLLAYVMCSINLLALEL